MDGLKKDLQNLKLALEKMQDPERATGPCDSEECSRDGAYTYGGKWLCGSCLVETMEGRLRGSNEGSKNEVMAEILQRRSS